MKDTRTKYIRELSIFVMSVTIKLKLHLRLLSSNTSSPKTLELNMSVVSVIIKQNGSATSLDTAVHDKIKYVCSKCEYKATWKSHLTRYSKSGHEGKRFPCTC